MSDDHIEADPAPKGGKFQPGRSGNLNGRPRKSANVGQEILSALGEKVTVKEGGKSKKITKLKATTKQLANKGASGDARSTKLLIELAQKAEDRAAAAAPVSVPLTAADDEIVQRMVARLLLIGKEVSHEPDHA